MEIFSSRIFWALFLGASAGLAGTVGGGVIGFAVALIGFGLSGH